MRKFHFNAAPQDKAAYVMPRGIVGRFAAATEGGLYASANLPLVTCVVDPLPGRAALTLAPTRRL